MSMNNASMLIVSVFSKSDNNCFWYSTQKQFIKDNTTIEYDYKVYLNGCNDTDFDNDDIIWTQTYDHSIESMSQNHLECLTKIKIDTKYQYFLLLDSDCFPIDYAWDIRLINKLAQFGMTQAAIFRPENLDIFPHPSAMFFVRNSFPNFRPIIYNTTNMLGIECNDVSCDSNFFPLIRTNKVNMHPICAGIYYDMFYHHGAGSRYPIFRSIDSGYYDYQNHIEWINTAFSMLTNDPHKFVNSLRR
jgi:hypothetical protein